MKRSDSSAMLQSAIFNNLLLVASLLISSLLIASLPPPQTFGIGHSKTTEHDRDIHTQLEEFSTIRIEPQRPHAARGTGDHGRERSAKVGVEG